VPLASEDVDGGDGLQRGEGEVGTGPDGGRTVPRGEGAELGTVGGDQGKRDGASLLRLRRVEGFEERRLPIIVVATTCAAAAAAAAAAPADARGISFRLLGVKALCPQKGGWAAIHPH